MIRISKSTLFLFGSPQLWGSMRVACHACTAASHEKIEVGALMRLVDVLGIQLHPAASGSWRRRPYCPARQRVWRRPLPGEAAAGNVERDHVAGTHERQRAAGRGFGRDVQDDGAVGGAAHARIGDADHIRYAFAQHFRRQGHVADFGHSGIAARAAILEDHDAGFVDVEIFVVDAGVKIFDRFEDDGAAAMLQQLRACGGGLITAPSGARLPRRTAMPAFALNGLAKVWITSRFQQGASATFFQIGWPFTVRASR